MKRFVLAAMVAVFSTTALAGWFPIDEDWDIIQLRGLEVKNPEIIKSADIAVARAVYWEDEGYEFEKKGDIYNLKITQIAKESGYTMHLTMRAQAKVGGFGWYPGYRTGTADCVIEIIRGDNDDWSWDGRNAEAECEIEYDGEE